MADEGSLGPEEVHALLPALDDARVVLGVGGAAETIRVRQGLAFGSRRNPRT